MPPAVAVQIDQVLPNLIGDLGAVIFLQIDVCYVVSQLGRSLANLPKHIDGEGRGRLRCLAPTGSRGCSALHGSYGTNASRHRIRIALPFGSLFIYMWTAPIILHKSSGGRQTSHRSPITNNRIVFSTSPENLHRHLYPKRKRPQPTSVSGTTTASTTFRQTGIYSSIFLRVIGAYS